MSGMRNPCLGTEALASWIEGSLSARERGRVESHLAGCDGCRRAVTIASQMESPPAGGTVNPVLLKRVVSTARRRPWKNWAAAAAILVAVAVAFALSGPGEQPGTVLKPTPPAPGPSEDVEETTRLVVKAPSPPDLAPKPAPVPLPEPEPKVQPEPEPIPPPEPSKSIVKDPPEPTDEPKPEPVPKRNPGKTEFDAAGVFDKVFVIDPAGDIRLRRGKGHPVRVGAFEKVGRSDVFEVAKNGRGGAFTLEAVATIALEKGAAVNVAYFKPDHAYSLTVLSGPVMVDTEGGTQNWKLTSGTINLNLTGVNGKISVEPFSDRISAVILDGRAGFKIGAETRPIRAGREVVLAADGTAETKEKRAVTLRRSLDRLKRLRPRTSTAFEADFEDGEAQGPFPYALPGGKVLKEQSIAYLRVAPADPVDLRPARPIECSDGMILRLRFRSDGGVFDLRLGEYRLAHPAGGARSRWREEDLPLAAFEHEGVPMVPGKSFAELRIEKEGGFLDVDRVQFLRRAR